MTLRLVVLGSGELLSSGRINGWKVPRIGRVGTLQAKATGVAADATLHRHTDHPTSGLKYHPQLPSRHSSRRPDVLLTWHGRFQIMVALTADPAPPAVPAQGHR